MDKQKILSKLENFWYYYKIHTFIAIIVIWFIATTLYQFFGTQKPDYEISLVSSEALDSAMVDSLRTDLVRCGTDLNGDGEVVVKLNHYQIDLTGQSAASSNVTALSSLDGDLVGKYSGLFLLEDVPSFWENTHALSYIDGGIPEENATDYENMAIPISQIPGLAGTKLDSHFIAVRTGHPKEAEYRTMLNLLKS